jgi:hypothetical protein
LFKEVSLALPDCFHNSESTFLSELLEFADAMSLRVTACMKKATRESLQATLLSLLANRLHEKATLTSL